MNRKEKIKGKKIDLAIIEESFDNIAYELKEKYKRNKMDDTVVEKMVGI